MKAVISILFGSAMAAGLCFAGGAVASYVLAKPDANHLTQLDAPALWTSEPKRVDASSQTFERLAPLVSAAYPIAAAKSRIAQANLPDADTAASQVATNVQHQEWCGARYRSYDPANDTYRSYGGEVRTCISPSTSPSPKTAASIGESASATEHATWCAQRYSSYRKDDNSYQPYEGPRRECVSPASLGGMETASR